MRGPGGVSGAAGRTARAHLGCAAVLCLHAGLAGPVLLGHTWHWAVADQERSWHCWERLRPPRRCHQTPDGAWQVAGEGRGLVRLGVHPALSRCRIVIPLAL